MLPVPQGRSSAGNSESALKQSYPELRLSYSYITIALLEWRVQPLALFRMYMYQLPT
jgi:hypothetical protein